MRSSLGSSTVRPVFVITGTSGEGKSTLARDLVERLPELELAVSATTRPRRPNEKDGRDYWFLSEEEFDRRLEAGEFLEWVELPWGEGYRSGTLWSELDRIASGGHSPLLEIETGGALAVRDRVPAAVTIFVTAPSKEELERRLRSRATESEGEIEERLDDRSAPARARKGVPAHDRQRRSRARARGARGNRPRGVAGGR